MTTDYSIADMMIGVRNMIEAADLRHGDQVLLLADTHSDKPTVEALNAGLRFFGAEPMILLTHRALRRCAASGPRSHARLGRRHLGVAGLHHLYPCASLHGTQARGERLPAP